MRYRGEEFSVGEFILGAFIGPVIGMPFFLMKVAVTAFAIYELWNWYLALRFGALTFAPATGLALIGTFIAFYPQPYSAKKSSDQMIEMVGDTILMPLFALLAGWIGTFFLL